MDRSFTRILDVGHGKIFGKLEKNCLALVSCKSYRNRRKFPQNIEKKNPFLVGFPGNPCSVPCGIQDQYLIFTTPHANFFLFSRGKSVEQVYFETSRNFRLNDRAQKKQYIDFMN